MDLAERHLRVCAGFGRAVDAVAPDRWGHPSPCDAWDARGVLEHVIGFHDVLVLRPLDAKPQRPRDDPARRWHRTHEALGEVFARPGVFNGQADLRRLVPHLSRDVLVHTWDLARAVGADDRLDPQLCAHFYERLPADGGSLAASGMFDAAVAPPPNADAQARLLTALGRDPSWTAR